MNIAIPRIRIQTLLDKIEELKEKIRKNKKDNKRHRSWELRYQEEELYDLREFKKLLLKEEAFYVKRFPNDIKQRVRYLLTFLGEETVYFADLKKRIAHHYEEIIKLETLRLESYEGMRVLFEKLKHHKKTACEMNERFKDQFKELEDIFEKMGDVSSPYLDTERG